jgi:hypothetical protein
MNMICNAPNLQPFSDSPVTCDLPDIFHARHLIPSFSPNYFLFSLIHARKRSEAVYAINSLFIGALRQVDEYLLENTFDVLHLSLNNTLYNNAVRPVTSKWES